MQRPVITRSLCAGAALTALLLGTAASAEPPANAQQPAAAAAAAQGGAGAAMAEVTDQKLEQFVEAIGEVQEVQTSYSERLQSAEDQDEAESLREEARDEMIGAVKDTGLTVDEYNLIAQRLQTDPALAERVRGLGAVE